MITRISKVSPDCEGEATRTELDKAAQIIRNGGLVAFPTETVYGLGADAFNAEAVEKIYKVKGRPTDNPLIAHICDYAGLEDIVKYVPSAAKKIIDAYWPGPLTVLFEKKENIPQVTTAGRETIAVRFPQNAVARELIRLAGVPVAAPSANASGRPSPTEAAHVEQDFMGKIDMILDGGSVRYGLESTIIDVTGLHGREIEILRPGSITQEMLSSIVPGVECAYDKPVNDLENPPRAPGMKYRHYAPLAEAFLVVSDSYSSEAMAAKIIRLAGEADNCQNIGILATEQTKEFYEGSKHTVLIAGDRNRPETIAANLFGMLRRFDDLHIGRIYCEAYPESGIGTAIMNRLKKACGGNII